MRIRELDMPMLWAFLEREADEFKWTHWFNKHIYMSKMLRLINENFDRCGLEEADFVHIESLTGLGCLQRKLSLTPRPWALGKSITMCLPPNPRNGGISYQVL